MTSKTASHGSLQSHDGEHSESGLAALQQSRYREGSARSTRRRLTAACIFIIALVAVMGSLFRYSGNAESDDLSLVYYTIGPRDFPVTVTERGTLESQNNVQVICEVDDVPDDGISGTPILWLIENGSSVEKGDLLVELDAASHIERIDQQVVDTTYARGQFIVRTLDVDNRITNNETVEAAAELAVQTAKLQLKQFEDEQGGTFQIGLQDVELGIQQREAQQLIDRRNSVGIQHLHELGYKSLGDVAQARLKALRANSALAREVARRRELVDYSYIRSRLQLEGAVASAERGLIQTERNNAAALAQQEVWLTMAKMGKFWNETRLKRYEDQLEKCKIYAPQSGMVAYHMDSDGRGNSSSIAEGVAVRYRQRILTIPDLTHMQVKTAVHESVIDSVRAGMRVTVRLDAFSDRQYEGTIDSVDVLPDPGGWLNSDTKVYKTIVIIDEEVDRIKPGMTAVVEIHIDLLHNVLCIPIQAIVQRGQKTWCYVAQNGQVTKSPVEVGRANDKFVEICSGLSAGDRVVLNPAVILAVDPDQASEIAPDRVSSGEL